MIINKGNGLSEDKETTVNHSNSDNVTNYLPDSYKYIKIKCRYSKINHPSNNSILADFGAKHNMLYKKEYFSSLQTILDKQEHPAYAQIGNSYLAPIRD